MWRSTLWMQQRALRAHPLPRKLVLFLTLLEGRGYGKSVHGSTASKGQWGETGVWWSHILDLPFRTCLCSWHPDSSSKAGCFSVSLHRARNGKNWKVYIYFFLICSLRKALDQGWKPQIWALVLIVSNAAFFLRLLSDYHMPDISLNRIMEFYN